MGTHQPQLRELEVALKLVRKKKLKAAAPGRKKKSEIDNFMDAIDGQLLLATGKKVKKGRGFARIWVEDGKEYGVEKVMVPRVGNRPLYPKSALVVDTKQKNAPTKELKELRKLVVDGKLSNRIYIASRKQKKAGPAKKR
jgi:hypothetical protein